MWYHAPLFVQMQNLTDEYKHHYLTNTKAANDFVTLCETESFRNSALVATIRHSDKALWLLTSVRPLAKQKQTSSLKLLYTETEE